MRPAPIPLALLHLLSVPQAMANLDPAATDCGHSYAYLVDLAAMLATFGFTAPATGLSSAIRRVVDPRPAPSFTNAAKRINNRRCVPVTNLRRSRVSVTREAAELMIGLRGGAIDQSMVVWPYRNTELRGVGSIAFYQRDKRHGLGSKQTEAIRVGHGHMQYTRIPVIADTTPKI